jgi:hypothetical protein
MKDEIRAVIEGLLKKSQEDKVAWVHASTLDSTNPDEAPVDPAAADYAVSTSSFTINVFRSRLGRDNAPKHSIRVNFLNEVGSVVSSDVASEGEEDYLLMENLLKMAEKYVLGADEERVLKRILDGLNKPGVFGSTDTEPMI